MIQTVLLGLFLVVNTHNYDSLFLQFIVNVLQFVQDTDVLLVLLVICRAKDS